MTDGVPHAVDAPRTHEDAPQSPNGVPDVQSGWLPPSEALRAILARPGFNPADDEWWHEERRNACRSYLGTCLNWRPGDRPGTVRVAASDLNCDIHRLLLADIRECWPWDDVLTLFGRLSAMSAGARFGATAVRVELADCLALGADYAKLDIVAEAVHDCRRRDERAKILKHALGVAHSPEGVEADIQRLREVR